GCPSKPGPGPRTDPDAPDRRARAPAGRVDASSARDQPRGGSAHTGTGQSLVPDQHGRPHRRRFLVCGPSPSLHLDRNPSESKPVGPGNARPESARVAHQTTGGASSKPALAHEANSHGGRGQSRRTPGAPARPRASNASANTESRGSSGPACGSRLCSSRVNNTRTSSARPPKRPSPPRTVDAGRPNPAAIKRCPAPAALTSNAEPITDPASARRHSHAVLNST